MRSLLYSIFFLLSISACEKEDPEWGQEQLNHELLISFPEYYTGPGLAQGREGRTFQKTRNDLSTAFNYMFCRRQFCNAYGDSLNPDSVYITHFTQELINTELDQEISLNNGGLFYYNLEKGLGKFFWKVEGVYRESLLVEYDKSLHHEVVEILESVKKQSF